MFKERIKGFVAGVCVTALLAGAATVFAQTIDVAMGGIKVYWDGVEKTLYDANGSKVEPMIYEGTTYVPLRAMSNLLGKEVDWEQQTLSVYIGEKPTAETVPIEQFPKEKIQKEGADVRTGDKATFKLKDKEIQCSNLLKGGGVTRNDVYNIYILDNKYSKLVGNAVMPYEKVGSSATGSLIFYSVTNDGKEKEIAKYEFKQTENPIDIDVNLLGVVNLKIAWSAYNTEPIALYDVSFISN